MPKHPKLDSIRKLLESGESFSLTEKEYAKKTGVPLPKENKYIKNNSALANLAKEYGYELAIQERTVTLVKKRPSK